MSLRLTESPHVVSALTTLSPIITSLSSTMASPLVSSLKSILFVYVLTTYTLSTYRHLRARGITQTVKEIYSDVAKRVLMLILRLPKYRNEVEKQLGAAKRDIELRLVGDDNRPKHLTLPSKGKSVEWVLNEMDLMDSRGKELSKVDWKDGRISGAVYHGGDDLTDLISKTYTRYLLSNPLHPDIFPSVRQMEAEVVNMVLAMYHGTPELGVKGAGTMTSGGTESIVMAVKAHRDWARATKGITKPEMVVPSSAHAAFDKAAAYFNIKVHTIPVDRTTRKVDIKKVRRAINPNTIMVVGSSVNFPDGNADPIVELSQLALKYKIGLHVDSCLGSFIVPFLESSGLAKGDDKGRYKMDLFDFRLPGVTSISCDTHKYGFSPKGTSVVMYRSEELRKWQYYVNTSWEGGVYASPSLSGSRPGALIAGTWAVMQHLGNSGYQKSCEEIVGAARTLANRIRTEIPELYILGDPPASVIAFGSRDPRVDILEVGDLMGSKAYGWHLNALGGDVKGVHIACTKLTVPNADKFISDLKECVKSVKSNFASSDTSGKKGTMVTLYGLGQSSAVGPSMVGELATAFLDTLYKA